MRPSHKGNDEISNVLAEKKGMPLAALTQHYLFSIKEVDHAIMLARNLTQIKS